MRIRSATAFSSTILAIACQVHTAAAWAGGPQQPSHKQTSKISTSTSMHETTADASSSNRRLLFLGSGVVVASACLTATTALPLAANAMVTDPLTAGSSSSSSTSSSSTFYAPAPHSMDGKLVVITGGNTGLGLESGKRLAAAGAKVVLTARSSAKGQQGIQAVQEYLSAQNIVNPNVYSVPLDLCDLASVQAFPSRLQEQFSSNAAVVVDVLMNNAGVMAIPEKEITKDGFERTFQTNHLGHFALTSGMVPLLAKDARIINVSSMAYTFAGKNVLELDNLNSESSYSPWASYGASKLANILFTKELQERVNASNGKYAYTVTTMHPGLVATDLGRYLVGEEKFASMKENGFTSWTDKVLFSTLAKFTKTVQDGASTQVFLASDPTVGGAGGAGGKYFDERKQVEVTASGMDMQKAKELWAVSEKLTGVQFNL